MNTPMTANVPTTKNPDYYPRNGTAVADTLMPWDPCRARIAPSAVLLMLVINVLTYRTPLYKLEEWAASLPLVLLWGEALDAFWKTWPILSVMGASRSLRAPSFENANGKGLPWPDNGTRTMAALRSTNTCARSRPLPIKHPKKAGS